MELKPLGNRVVVRPDAPPTTTPTGIILPKDPVEDRAERGVVVSVGAAVTAVYAGQFVRFGKFTGESGKVDGGESLLVMREDDILAVEEV